MLVHYYKTKCEVSGEDLPLNFLTGLYRIQNDRKSSIIYLDWPYIGFNGGLQSLADCLVLILLLD